MNTATVEAVRGALYNPGMLPVMGDSHLAPSKKWREVPEWHEVIEARQAVWEGYGLRLSHSIWSQLVHGDHVWLVDESDMGSGSYNKPHVKADAIICPKPHPEMSLVIKGADCPILGLQCADTGAIGVVHAGVAGQRKGIIATAIEAMVYRGAKRQAMKVFVGPFISHHHYRHPRYGGMVRFFYEHACAYLCNGWWHVNQEEMIRRQLYAAGIRPENTYFDGRCTYADPGLISHVQTREANQGVDGGAFQRGNNVMIMGPSMLD